MIKGTGKQTIRTSGKLFKLFLGLSLIASLFFGCTQDADNGKTRIHFVTWKANVPEAWDEIFRLFKEEHPGIEVITETGPHSSTAFHDLLTQKLKNRSTDVDVFLMDVIWRKDLLDRYRLPPPRTWDQMVVQAELITEEEKRLHNADFHGFSGQFKQYEGLVCNMMEYILSNGGHILNADTGKSGLAEKEAIDAVRFVRDNVIAKIAPRGVLTYQEPESLDLFVQGKAVFHRNWPYAWGVSNNPERSRIAGKVGIAKLPLFEGNQSYSTLGGWHAGISSYSKNKDAAWTFIQFLTSEKIQKVIALKAGKAPTRTSLYNDADILKSYPHFKDMKDVFLTAYPRPRTALYPAVSNVLQRYFSRAISSPDLNLEEEANKASREIEQILSLEKQAG